MGLLNNSGESCCSKCGSKSKRKKTIDGMAPIAKCLYRFCVVSVFMLALDEIWQNLIFTQLSSTQQHLDDAINSSHNHSFPTPRASAGDPAPEELLFTAGNHHKTAQSQSYTKSSGPLTHSSSSSSSSSFPNQSVALDNRWICIQRIRKRHWDSLSPYFSRLYSSGEIPASNSPANSSANQNQLLLVDPAYHPNLGDTLLTNGEYAFFRRIWEKATAASSRNMDRLDRTKEKAMMGIDECDYGHPYRLYVGKLISCGDYFERARASLSVNDKDKSARLAVWHAGGNWGELYPRVQLSRIGSFKIALEANFSIVGMPQSMYYQNAATKHDQAEQIRTKVRKGIENITQTFSLPTTSESMEDLARARIVLTWREQESYTEATRLYPFVTNLLVPDIAFQLGPFWGDPTYDPPKKNETKQDTVDILFLLRDDKESLYKQERTGGEVLTRFLAKHHNSTWSKPFTFIVVDWTSRQAMFQNRDVLNTQTAVQMLKLGRVVICDRLHAAILSYLAGVPFVFLDQISNKVTNVLSVAFMPYNKTGTKHDDHDCMDGRMHWWAKATNMDDAISKAVQFLVNHGL